MRKLLTAAVAFMLISGSRALVCAQPQQPGEPKKITPDDVPLLVEALTHADQQIRIRSANMLLVLPSVAAGQLVERVSTGDMLHTASAAVVLDRMGDNAIGVSDRLQSLLADDRIEQWRWFTAAVLLDRIDPASRAAALPSLIAAVESSDPMRQLAAVHVIAAMKEEGQAALPALRRLLNRPREPFVGMVVGERVLTDNAPAFTQQVPAYDDLLIVKAMNEVGASADELLPPLVEQLRSDSPSVRLMASRLLSELGSSGKQAAADALVRLLITDRVDLRERAAEILKTLGPDAAESVPALIPLLKESRDDVRRAAADALGAIGPAAKEALPALQEALKLETLLQTGNDEAMQKAIDSISGSDGGNRTTAAL